MLRVLERGVARLGLMQMPNEAAQNTDLRAPCLLLPSGSFSHILLTASIYGRLLCSGVPSGGLDPVSSGGSYCCGRLWLPTTVYLVMS